jgi:hypothetical protein
MKPEPTPARVSHLLTLSVLSEQIAPTYAVAHNRLPDEVYDEVRTGLSEGRMQGPLCDAVWRAVQKARPRLENGERLEKLAEAMRSGGPRPAAAPEQTREGMMALLALIDANVGRASPAARTALESPAGQQALDRALLATGDYLAMRLLSAAGRRPKAP